MSTQGLYGGLSGFVLEPECFELGQGIVFSQTYAHLMAPFLMAFSPAEPGKPHPAPWKPAGGGLSIDISAELFVPATCRVENLDAINILWWIAALLRLRAATTVRVPVVSSEKFSAIPTLKHEPDLSLMEGRGMPLRAEKQVNRNVGLPELQWIKAHWERAASLLATEKFNVAFQAVDYSIWNSSPSLGLVTLWGALERLFSENAQELSFRVSANIASYLEKPGAERHLFFKQVKKLYDHRSQAAHGTAKPDITPYQDTYAIARRALMKMIEEHHVPDRKELEGHLFGDEPRRDPSPIA
jgi:hypothetical protein